MLLAIAAGITQQYHFFAVVAVAIPSADSAAAGLSLMLLASPDGCDLLDHISRRVQVDEALVDPSNNMRHRQHKSKLVIADRDK